MQKRMRRMTYPRNGHRDLDVSINPLGIINTHLATVTRLNCGNIPDDLDDLCGQTDGLALVLAKSPGIDADCLHQRCCRRSCGVVRCGNQVDRITRAEDSIARLDSHSGSRRDILLSMITMLWWW